MKKLFILLVVVFTTCSITIAQPRAIGGRLPILSYGVSYQHGIGEKNMLQMDVDILGYYTGIQATVTYNWIFPIASWGIGDMNWYAGVGAGGGYAWSGWSWRYRYRILDDGFGSDWGSWGQYGFVGVAGMGGVEMNFKFGLQVSFDFRPLIGPCFYKGGGAGYFLDGLFSGAINFGVRYKF